MAYLKEKQIPYKEKNIISSILNEEELKDILAKSDNGTDDIISKRSKVIKDNKINVNDMTIKDLIKFIKDNPTVLKRPIIVNDRLIQVGYNEDEISTFIPRELRNFSNDFCGECCPNFKEDCCKEK